MKRITFIIIITLFLVVGAFQPRVAEAGYYGCRYESQCDVPADSSLCEPCASGQVCCEISTQKSEGEVIIPVDGDDWLEKVFGSGGLVLNILKPVNFWSMEGTASIWSIIAFLYTFFTAILFVAFIVAIGIGAIRWMSSMGEETKVQSARKWVSNAFKGLMVVVVVFIGVSVVTWLIGVGSVFDLAQNLAVCGDHVQYESKTDQCGDVYSDCECECSEGASDWSCN
ncbi:hypothetical protein JW766_01160 [Candidatus Dojkabacteria bacterium]|nr:hypothetical protein [Candidatus Dojkabacteria bacterium]